MSVAPIDDSALTSTAYMYGRDSYYDGPCAAAYDPMVHAEDLGLPVIYRDDLPESDMVACYSAEHSAIFVRPNLRDAVERCAIAHEIVHHEHRDSGRVKRQEDRADRVAARRLVRPSDLEQLGAVTDDIGRAALELGVTERIMRAYVAQQ